MGPGGHPAPVQGLTPSNSKWAALHGEGKKERKDEDTKLGGWERGADMEGVKRRVNFTKVYKIFKELLKDSKVNAISK